MLLKRKESLPEFPKLVRDFFDKEFLDWSNSNFSNTNTTLPAVNIKENKDSFLVDVAVPGMKKDDFEIDLEDNVLTISSQKEDKKEDKNKDEYTRREYSYQSFKRSFTLPERLVKSDKISAKYDNGELKITIPKKEEAKQKEPKKIKIS